MASFVSASIVENVRFNQAVIVPNALQGLFRRRPRAVAAATRVNIDGQAMGLLAGLKRKSGGRPIWVRVVKDPALLLLDPADVARALDGSPHPFASDPEAKRKGMAHFQPDALTISRGPLWEERRRFTEAVLVPGAEHPLATRFGDVARKEAGAAADAGVLDHDVLHAAFRRLGRRIVLGDHAAGEERVSELLGELMSQANGLPGERSAEHEPFAARMRSAIVEAQEGSLAAVAAATPASPDVRPDGQLAHWLFATQDTLAVNVLRALALVALHPGAEDDLRGALLEAMRLWPTTPLLSRELVADVTWHGVRVPAGTNVLISNTFLHRERERLGAAADRFRPDGWADGGALAADRGLNALSSGPQGCPGATLALDVGVAVMQAVLERGPWRLERPSVDPGQPLPQMLDPFALRLARG